MKRLILLTCLLAFVSVAEAWAKRPGRSFRRSFVQVSARDPRYFCLSDGQPYIPVGCNIAAMGSVADMEHYLGKMHRNGANFGRVWLNTNLFEIETRYGEVDTAKLVRIDRLLELADRYGIKIKFCIESFRHIRPGVNKWDTKASYHTSNGGLPMPTIISLRSVVRRSSCAACASSASVTATIPPFSAGSCGTK